MSKYNIRYIPDLDSRFIDNVIEPTLAERTTRAEWFARLEESIRRDGVKNPVILTAIRTAQELSLTPRYGGSRIWVAQRFGLPVPAIVADFSDVFPEYPPITTSAALRLFPNPPKKMIMKPNGINVSGCPDIHMV